jgi:hypothetical protein
MRGGRRRGRIKGRGKEGGERGKKDKGEEEGEEKRPSLWHLILSSLHLTMQPRLALNTHSGTWLGPRFHAQLPFSGMTWRPLETLDTSLWVL